MRAKKPSPFVVAATDTHLSPPKFAAVATRVVVAQILRVNGFTSAQRSTLDTLADIAGKYLSALAMYASASAVSSGRTQSNLNDVVIALESIGSVQGFPGASNLSRPILSSAILQELLNFVDRSLEIPFAQAVRRRREPACKIVGRGIVNGNRYGHVPRWLPEFPDIEKKIEVRKREEGVYGCFSNETGDVKDKGIVLVDDKTSVGLPEKRERVKFTIRANGVYGTDPKIGVCKGGKRVFCQNSIEYDEDVIDSKLLRCNTIVNGSDEAAVAEDLSPPLKYYKRRKRLKQF